MNSLYFHDNENLKIGFDRETASLDFLGSGDENLLAPTGASTRRPLFVLRFRNTTGWPSVVSSLDLGAPQFETQPDHSLKIIFDGRNAVFNVRAEISVQIAPDKAESECASRWNTTAKASLNGLKCRTLSCLTI
jgi:hypothetical protein